MKILGLCFFFSFFAGLSCTKPTPDHAFFFFGKAIAVVLFVGRKVGLARIDSGQSTEHEGLGD